MTECARNLNDLRRRGLFQRFGTESKTPRGQETEAGRSLAGNWLCKNEIHLKWLTAGMFDSSEFFPLTDRRRLGQAVDLQQPRAVSRLISHGSPSAVRIAYALLKDSATGLLFCQRSEKSISTSNRKKQENAHVEMHRIIP